MLKWIWLSAVVVLLDQWSKGLASTHLAYLSPVPLLPSLNLTLMHNSGAAFSFLSDASGWQRWFFTAVALGISVVILLWLRRLPAGQHGLAAALALILGGALGNVWDRIMLGYVVDFIDLYYQQWHWPAFNIADSAITVGALLLIVDAMFLSRKPESQP